ncbi:MAG TPA: hypothetical protein VHX44_15925, partial [Planctomycetota bacterium]|nr:hypothetical protein [Planctomycetota bacterium]
ERHRGHFFNWYDTQRLAPLNPRYVSTVDSGNLAGALLVLAQGLQALQHQRPDPALVVSGLRATATALAFACDQHPEAHGVVAEVRMKLLTLPQTSVTDHLTTFADWTASQEPVFARAGDDAV